jgi:hypothetical protein
MLGVDAIELLESVVRDRVKVHLSQLSHRRPAVLQQRARSPIDRRALHERGLVCEHDLHGRGVSRREQSPTPVQPPADVKCSPPAVFCSAIESDGSPSKSSHSWRLARHSARSMHHEYPQRVQVNQITGSVGMSVTVAIVPLHIGHGGGRPSDTMKGYYGRR